MSCTGAGSAAETSITALGERAWPEIGRVTLLVPVGSTEQHGLHLPLDTDTRIAAAVASRAGGPDLLVAPPIAYGAAGEHEAFAGTVSIGHAALRLLLVELGRSAARWAGRLVFVNGHGGNVPTLVEAVTLLRYEGRDAAWFPCAPGGDAHPAAPRRRWCWPSTPRSYDPVRSRGTRPRSPSCCPRCARAGWRR
jgi:mycofactocin system creatininase family protein